MWASELACACLYGVKNNCNSGQALMNSVNIGTVTLGPLTARYIFFGTLKGLQDVKRTRGNPEKQGRKTSLDTESLDPFASIECFTNNFSKVG